MDYKKIIKSRALRSKILQMLSFIPDKEMLQLQYFIKFGRMLNLANPKRFTEKLQWYKLYYKNPLMIQCVDKYEVREYVKSKGLEDILIPCYGVYDSVDEVDWDALPDQFVMKDTLGGGGNSVIIIKDKKIQDIEQLKTIAHHWLERDAHVVGGGREWPYYSGKNHRIIFDKYISSNEFDGGLIDYKFFCFNGHVEFLQYMANRKIGSQAEVAILDRNFCLLPVKRADDPEYSGSLSMPPMYYDMVKIAEILSSDFPHARIDLYNKNGKIMFGEVTFFGASGFYHYDPDEYDFILGEKFKL